MWTANYIWVNCACAKQIKSKLLFLLLKKTREKNKNFAVYSVSVSILSLSLFLISDLTFSVATTPHDCCRFVCNDEHFLRLNSADTLLFFSWISLYHNCHNFEPYRNERALQLAFLHTFVVYRQIENDSISKFLFFLSFPLFCSFPKYLTKRLSSSVIIPNLKWVKIRFNFLLFCLFEWNSTEAQNYLWNGIQSASEMKHHKPRTNDEKEETKQHTIAQKLMFL